MSTRWGRAKHRNDRLKAALEEYLRSLKSDEIVVPTMEDLHMTRIFRQDPTVQDWWNALHQTREGLQTHSFYVEGVQSFVENLHEKFAQSLSIVRHIPDDILHNIFLHGSRIGVMESLEIDDVSAYTAAMSCHNHSVTTATEVCRHWRAVALSSTAMWSYLDLSWRTHKFSLWISRSGIQPLTLFSSKSSSSKNIAIALEHTHRWRQLQLNLKHKNGRAVFRKWSLFDSDRSYSALQRLSIDSHNNTGPISCTFPNLLTLNLTFINKGWDAIGHALVNLKLDLDTSSVQGLGVARNIWGSCTMLQDLSIQWEVGMRAPNDTPPAITMPSLRKLHLNSTIRRGRLTYLINSFITPQLVNLHVQDNSSFGGDENTLLLPRTYNSVRNLTLIMGSALDTAIRFMKGPLEESAEPKMNLPHLETLKNNSSHGDLELFKSFLELWRRYNPRSPVLRKLSMSAVSDNLRTAWSTWNSQEKGVEELEFRDEDDECEWFDPSSSEEEFDDDDEYLHPDPFLAGFFW